MQRTDKSKIILLGTGTCQIQKDRMASSVLIQLPNLRVVYDMGRGTTQRLLADLNYQNDDIEHIVISHFHPDHTSDLIPFLMAAAHSKIDPRSRDLHIYGYRGLKKKMGQFYQVALDPGDLVVPRYKIIVHEIINADFKIRGQVFNFIDLPPVDNHGLKFTYNKKIVAISGDSHFHPQEVAFLKDVDLAVIDAGHPTVEEVIKLAVASQPKTLVCSHLYRELNEKEMRMAARAAGFKGKLIIGRDLMKFESQL